jgi:hypothetical protein
MILRGPNLRKQVRPTLFYWRVKIRVLGEGGFNGTFNGPNILPVGPRGDRQI